MMEKQFSLSEKKTGRGYSRLYSEDRIKALFMLNKTPDNKSVPDLIGSLEVGSKFDCDKINMPNSFIGMIVTRLK